MRVPVSLMTKLLCICSLCSWYCVELIFFPLVLSDFHSFIPIPHFVFRFLSLCVFSVIVTTNEVNNAGALVNADEMLQCPINTVRGHRLCSPPMHFSDLHISDVMALRVKLKAGARP